MIFSEGPRDISPFPSGLGVARPRSEPRLLCCPRLPARGFLRAGVRTHGLSSYRVAPRPEVLARARSTALAQSFLPLPSRSELSAPGLGHGSGSCGAAAVIAWRRPAATGDAVKISALARSGTRCCPSGRYVTPRMLTRAFAFGKGL